VCTRALRYSAREKSVIFESLPQPYDGRSALEAVSTMVSSVESGPTKLPEKHDETMTTRLRTPASSSSERR
jgi:hypothetical protein